MIAIIGVLIALLLPAVQSAREAARKLQCAAKFTQVGVAANNYQAAKGVFPTGQQTWTTRSEAGRPPCANPPISEDPLANLRYYGWGWGTFILPFIEESTLFDQFDFRRGGRPPYGQISDGQGYAYKHSRNFKAAAMPVELYLCPSDPQGFELVDCDPRGPCWDRSNGAKQLEDCAKTNMVGCMGTPRIVNGQRVNFWCTDGSGPRGFGNGMMYNRSRITPGDVTDGTSQTILVGETVGDIKGSHNGYFWATHGNIEMRMPINHALRLIPTADNSRLGVATSQERRGHMPWFDTLTSFASWHPGGCHFVFVDGSVHFISENASWAALEALATRNVGDMAGTYE